MKAAQRNKVSGRTVVYSRRPTDGEDFAITSRKTARIKGRGGRFSAHSQVTTDLSSLDKVPCARGLIGRVFWSRREYPSWSGAVAVMLGVLLLALALPNQEVKRAGGINAEAVVLEHAPNAPASTLNGQSLVFYSTAPMDLIVPKRRPIDLPQELFGPPDV